MNILVLGGNRFFGKALVNYLSADKEAIWVYNRGNRKVEYPRRAQHIIGDRSNYELLKKIIVENKIESVVDQICFDADTAEATVKMLLSIEEKDRPQWIHTSSQSVYGPGMGLCEDQFVPVNHKIRERVSTEDDYAEAKRQAEAIYFNSELFDSICAVRFPIVIGSDDYTGRFQYHIDALKNKKEVFFPNLDASISFIHSDDAAICLQELIRSFEAGPINCCAPKPVKLGNFLKVLEAHYGKQFILGSDPHYNFSPYGIGQDWWMDADKMIKKGIRVKEIPDIIVQILREIEN